MLKNIGNKIFYIRIKLNSLISKVYNYFMLMCIWNIDIKKECKFNGKLIVWKSENSIITIGENCFFISNQNTRNLVGINRACTLITQKKNSKIIIGNNSGFSGTVISSALSVKIGNNVKCGANTQIIDSDWHFEDYRSGQPSEINIEDNVWLGINTIVLKGVTIGENTVIGANSVVSHSIPSNVIAAGNPCKVIKSIDIK